MMRRVALHRSLQHRGYATGSLDAQKQNVLSAMNKFSVEESRIIHPESFT